VPVSLSASISLYQPLSASISLYQPISGTPKQSWQ